MKKENNFYGVDVKIGNNNIYNNYNYNIDKSLKIKIRDKEYEIDDQNLIHTLIELLAKTGNYNLNNKKNINYNRNEYRQFASLKKNLFPFPKELDKNTLELFISLLIVNLDENINLCGYIRKLINICIEFQLYDIIEKEVNEYLLSKISKSNCIEIVINFIDLIFDEKLQNLFINLIRKSLSTISFYLPEFIINRKDSLLLLTKETLEEIIEIYIENKVKFKEKNINMNKKKKEDEEKDIKNVFDLLMYARNIKNDIFLLLEDERKNALKNFELFINEDKDFKPIFIWKLKYSDIKNEIYQEHKICVDNINLLLICYYESAKDVFQLALQIVGINFNPSSNNKDNNLFEKNIKNELNDYNNKSNETITKNNVEDDKNSDYILNLIETISILYLCELPEIGFKSKINFNCVQQNCKSKFLVFKLENFSKLIGYSTNAKKVIDFSIKFYFYRNYIFSSIINHISNNLKIYHKSFSVNKIPKLALSIILKNENIINSPKNESYKLHLIKNWLKNRNNYSEKNILDLFKLIKWSNLSTNDLIDFFIYNSKLLISIKELKNDLFYEIQRRFQNEYFNFFQNDKILLTNNIYNSSESNTESIKNIIPKIDKNENNNTFTFDFLTKLLTYFSEKSIQDTTNKIFPAELSNREIYYSPFEEGRNIYKLYNQRNYSNYNDIPKPKISKSIRLNESPYYNNIKQKDHIHDTKYINLNKKNNFTTNNSKSSRTKNRCMFYINNLTNNKKKSSNSTIISNYHDKSAKNLDNEDKKGLMPKFNKKVRLNNIINYNSKIYSSDFQIITNINGGKSSSLVINKQPNKMINRKNHSKSVDKNGYDNSVHKKSIMSVRSNVDLLNKYLGYNNNENGQNKYINFDKSSNGLQKNNYISMEDRFKYNNKLNICGKSHSKAKLIKSFNSPFSVKKRLMKNTSENKSINSKIKRFNY